MAMKLYVRLEAHDGSAEDIAINLTQFGQLINAKRLVTKDGAHSFNFEGTIPAYYSPENPLGSAVCLRFLEVTDNVCYLLIPDAEGNATLHPVYTTYTTPYQTPVISAEGAY